VLIAVILAIPRIFPGVVRMMNPNSERDAMAQELERQQRASAERMVSPRGETLHAVVYLPARPSAEPTAAQQRGLIWWSRVLAAVLAAGLLQRTIRLMRRAGGEPAS
jgi:anti-sigma factor RsiW